MKKKCLEFVLWELIVFTVLIETEFGKVIGGYTPLPFYK